MLPLHRHEFDTGRIVVAETAGEIVGFGATLVRSGVAYIADLFVCPDQQSEGTGAALLEALLGDHTGPRFTLASTDPRARALYERFGMHPVVEYSYLHARPDEVAIERLDASGVELETTTVGAEILAIDRGVTQRDRHHDLHHAETHLGARTLRARRRGETVGYAQVVHPIWWHPSHPDAVRIGPVVALDPDDLVPILAATIMNARGLRTDSLGPFVPLDHPAHAALVDAGFVVHDRDLLMASRPDLIDSGRYFPAVDTA